MDYVIANYESIAKSSQIVPMTTDQAAKGKQELEKAEARRRLMEAAGAPQRARAPSPSWGRRAAAMART